MLPDNVPVKWILTQLLVRGSCVYAIVSNGEKTNVSEITGQRKTQKSHISHTLKEHPYKIIVPLQLMFKKIVSILMLFSALAIMLGHNFIGHHHHDFEHTEVAHHHNEGHHHDHDTENESDDWAHLFSGLQHGTEGLTFLTSHSAVGNYSKPIPQFTVLHTSGFAFHQVIIEVRQNAPPYLADYCNSQNFLPSGLRAPPIFIV